MSKTPKFPPHYAPVRYGLPEPSEKAMKAANLIADDFTTGFFTDEMVMRCALHIDAVFEGKPTELLTTL